MNIGSYTKNNVIFMKFKWQTRLYNNICRWRGGLVFINMVNIADELLEDLQSTVASRPKMYSAPTGSTGYRQTYKEVSSQRNGLPKETSKEYEVDYLKPSNSTFVATERPKSPFLGKVRLVVNIKLPVI